MPTYQYACTNPECANRFELVQSFTDPSATECPVCGSPVRKVYGSVGVVFKGSGFYRNDSRADRAGDQGRRRGRAPSTPARRRRPARRRSSSSDSGSGSSGGSSTRGRPGHRVGLRSSSAGARLPPRSRSSARAVLAQARRRVGREVSRSPSTPHRHGGVAVHRPPGCPQVPVGAAGAAPSASYRRGVSPTLRGRLARIGAGRASILAAACVLLAAARGVGPRPRLGRAGSRWWSPRTPMAGGMCWPPPTSGWSAGRSARPAGSAVTPAVARAPAGRRRHTGEPITPARLLGPD